MNRTHPPISGTLARSKAPVEASPLVAASCPGVNQASNTPAIGFSARHERAYRQHAIRATAGSTLSRSGFIFVRMSRKPPTLRKLNAAGSKTPVETSPLVAATLSRTNQGSTHLHECVFNWARNAYRSNAIRPTARHTHFHEAGQ